MHLIVIHSIKGTNIDRLSKDENKKEEDEELVRRVGGEGRWQVKRGTFSVVFASLLLYHVLILLRWSALELSTCTSQSTKQEIPIIRDVLHAPI